MSDLRRQKKAEKEGTAQTKKKKFNWEIALYIVLAAIIIAVVVAVPLAMGLSSSGSDNGSPTNVPNCCE